MAREIQFGPWTTGAVLYGNLKRASDGYLRDVVANAWDAPLTADWDDYDIPLTEDSTTGHYVATAPSGVTLSDGLISIIVYEQVGGSPAPTDTFVGEARATPYVAQVASVSGSVGSVAGAVAGPVAQVSSFTTAGKAEIQQEAEDALAAVGLTTTVTGRIDAAVSSRLATASYSSPPSASTIAAAVWAAVAENSKTYAQIVRGMWSILRGKSSGFGSGASTPVFRDDADSKNRLTFTVDANGNKTAATVNDLD